MATKHGLPINDGGYSFGVFYAGVVGTDDNDFLYGHGGDDYLFGGLGDDYIDGGTGADHMIGDAGNDTYIVDSAGDDIEENNESNGGYDTVKSHISGYTLGQNVEGLRFYDDAGAATGSGNSLDNYISGNRNNNVLYGLDGYDTLEGFDGRDTLYGGAGRDTLNGGSDNDKLFGGNDADTLYGEDGADELDGGLAGDTMYGGRGDDTYIVSNDFDQVIENSGQGLDTVFSSLGTYTLTANVEDMVIEGASAFHGTGNALDNQIVGNENANTLLGMDGNDTLFGFGGDDTLNGGAGGTDHLYGGLGNDTYVIRDSNDVVHESLREGIDTVNALTSYTLTDNVENLNLGFGSTGTGNSLSNVITGNAYDNTLNGGGGDDTIIGGTETDVEALSGGTGRDTFLYRSRAESFTTATHTGDIILDFNTDQDLIDLRALGVNVANLRLDDSGVGVSGRQGHLFEDLNGNNTFDANELNINLQLTGSATFSLLDVLV